jgi:phage baseplate assembly protein W
MLREIYCKIQADPTFQNNVIEHQDVYEATLSKIRMILFTNKGDVLGEPDFGTSLEDYVFETRVSGEDIKKMILQQIVTYVPESEFFNIDVSVSFRKGATNDTCFVDIKLNGTSAIGILLN